MESRRGAGGVFGVGGDSEFTFAYVEDISVSDVRALRLCEYGIQRKAVG